MTSPVVLEEREEGKRIHKGDGEKIAMCVASTAHWHRVQTCIRMLHAPEKFMEMTVSVSGAVSASCLCRTSPVATDMREEGGRCALDPVCAFSKAICW